MGLTLARILDKHRQTSMLNEERFFPRFPALVYTSQSHIPNEIETHLLQLIVDRVQQQNVRFVYWIFRWQILPKGQALQAIRRLEQANVTTKLRNHEHKFV